MAGKSRRATSKPPRSGARPTTSTSSHRRGQTLVLSQVSAQAPTSDNMDDAYAATLREMDNDVDPLYDHAYLSHISKEFATMRPFDFELPKYDFYEESSDDSWFDDDNKSSDDTTLEDLLFAHEVDEAEDVATTIHFIFPGKPRVVDVSPPASIRGRHSTSSSRSSIPTYHSRSSSYSAASHTDENKSLGSSSSSSSASDDSGDDDAHTPSTPASTYSNPQTSFFPHFTHKTQEPKYCSIAVARPAPLIIRKA